MPLGTNGDSIYRPATAPPGTVCTGNGIGVQVRDGEGHVLFVMGLYDGKIYMGDQYSDPNLPTIQAATIINGQIVSPPAGPTIVNLNGTDYVMMTYEMANGQSQTINIRLDLYQSASEGGANGAIATGLIAAAFLDLTPGLLTNMPDMDHDGDVDFNDAEAVYKEMFLDQADTHFQNGDNVNGIAFTVLANSVPTAFDLLATWADITTGDDNQPPPPDGGDGGGSGDLGGGGGGGPGGDSGWMF